MPGNNNQKVQGAAARLANLPVVQSACIGLSLLYTDTKSSHPNLRAVCEVLESSVTAISTSACDRFSPVTVKLEPQISLAMDIACKSLDWLEMKFPVIHAPTEQIVATAKNKIHDIQSVVSIAANGTVERVQYTADWLLGKRQQVDDQAALSLMERAIGLVSVGLDSALIMSEALMDRVLPPTEDDREEGGHLLEGFEVAALRRSYPARLVSLVAKLGHRTYQIVWFKMHSIQFMENWSRSSDLAQDFQTSWLALACSTQELPQYLQNQFISMFFFISQMYNLSFPPSQHGSNGYSCLNADTATHKNAVEVHLKATPAIRRRQTKMSVLDMDARH